jgi:hypothetical protein
MTRVSAGSLADVLSFLNTTTGVCGFARRRPLLPQRNNECLRVRSQTSSPSSTRQRVSAGAPADVLSLLNTITGVCGCARRRPLLPQHDDGCLWVRPQTSSQLDDDGCLWVRPQTPSPSPTTGRNHQLGRVYGSSTDSFLLGIKSDTVDSSNGDIGVSTIRGHLAIFSRPRTRAAVTFFPGNRSSIQPASGSRISSPLQRPDFNHDDGVCGCARRRLRNNGSLRVLLQTSSLQPDVHWFSHLMNDRSVAASSVLYLPLTHSSDPQRSPISS